MPTTEEETDEGAPVRASGATPAAEEAHEVAAAIDQLLSPETVGEDIDRPHREPRFNRMRFNYQDPREVQVLMEAHHDINRVVVREFIEAYLIIDEIRSIVRIPTTEDGEDVYDDNGEPVWETTPAGRIIEDYTRLTRKQQEAFLGQITTNLFSWEQKAEMMHMDALMARAKFEEEFAVSYDDLRGTAGRTTVDDRKSYGAMEAAQDRYYAIYVTALSRRAMALVRSMERLSQRMKDVLVAG